jgi:serine/threonine-protein phosphatase 2A regulatory subunit B
MDRQLDVDAILADSAQYYSKHTSEWEFSQMFGEEDDPSSDTGSEDSGAEDNWISSLSFDVTGKFLAVGYNCGQVVVLTQQEDMTYQLYTEFKSHDSEFDFLTSMEIEEKINMIKWYPFRNGSQHLLTTNDKTVKLFRMWEKGDSSAPEVNVKSRKVFEGAHAYNINSVAFNSDGETFISTDDLRINLWNVNISNEAFGIVDIKPENMDELTEVITCADFHPQECNVLIYATSKGVIRMGDLRSSALCEQYTKEYEDTESDIGGFFQELVTTISDVKFSPDGNFIVSRDYLTMKIWDPRVENRPLKIVKFHDHLIPKLCDLYENDSIFDKFECSWNGNSNRLLTGSYNNNFYICDAFGSGVTHMTALKPGMTAAAFNSNQHLDSSQKVLHTAWHPTQDIIALGAKDFGYLYLQKPPNDDDA